MIYLFLGEDSAQKDRKITEIKTKCLHSDDALKLDYETLNGTKCDPATLKSALIALPAIATNRLILIRSVEKLNTQNKEIILELIQSGHHHIVLILDTNEISTKNKFFSKIASEAEMIRFGNGANKQNVFDMTRAMQSRNSQGALKILSYLMEEGNHPLQIMGGLVWFWGKSKNQLSSTNFKKGLLVLQEGDLNIKRSRLKPEYAIEIVVTKLSSLIAC